MKKMTKDEFITEAVSRFGEDSEKWRFVCPGCKTEQTLADLEKAGCDNPKGSIAFSCIGRFDKERGCNWTLGGFFQIHTMVVTDGEEEHPMFEFAENKEPST